MTFAPSRARALAAVVLGLLVPGLGHSLANRSRRGAALGALVLLSFGVGLALDGPLLAPSPGRPLSWLGAAASYASGLPAVAATLAGAGKGDPRGATYDYGLTFLLSAGVMNVLALFDAWDRASGRHR